MSVLGIHKGMVEMKQTGMVIEFLPRSGDIVEFLSDGQTEKGPSSGSVVEVDYHGDTCVIQHSDVRETFVMSRVVVAKYSRHRNHPDRLPHWTLV